MEQNTSKEKELYSRYSKKVTSLLEDKDAREIFDSLENGQNKYMRVDRVESSAFDLSWIQAIEDCIPDLGDIVNNPRLVTKTTEDLVPVELAKKTGAVSVQHLASHTQYIKTIDEAGNVVPSKILSLGSDDEIHTYENRFIATLIRHLVFFIQKRYEYVVRFAALHDHEMLYFKDRSTVNGAKVEIETRVKVDSEKTDPSSLENKKYVERIATMRQYILYYYNSKFMKMFRTEQEVHNPILQTNIIRKNPLYHKCYELWLFLGRYDKLGVSYSVKEEYTKFNADELHQLNCLMLANYLSLQGKDKPKQKSTTEYYYYPTILTSSDDEALIYGPLLQGPIEYVRVDKGYQKFLDNRVEQGLPKDPNEEEKAYFDEEYSYKKLTVKRYNETMNLLRRKKQEKADWDRHIGKVIKEQLKQEEIERKKREAERLKREEDYLDNFRRDIIDEARAFVPPQREMVKEIDPDFLHKVLEKYSLLLSGLDLGNEPDRLNELTYGLSTKPEDTEPVSKMEIQTKGLEFSSYSKGGRYITRVPVEVSSQKKEEEKPQNEEKTSVWDKILPWKRKARLMALTKDLDVKQEEGRVNYASTARVENPISYVVLTLDGYYVSENVFTYRIEEAQRFDKKTSEKIALREKGRALHL